MESSLCVIDMHVKYIYIYIYIYLCARGRVLCEKEPYNVKIALMCWVEESLHIEDFVRGYIKRIPYFKRT
jgi:hypothetical protein